MLPVLGCTPLLQIPPASTAVMPHCFAATCVIQGCLHPMLQFHTSSSYCASCMSVDAARHTVAQDLGNQQLCAHMGGFDGAGMPSPGPQLLLGAVLCVQKVAFSLQDGCSRLAGNSYSIDATTVQPRTCEAECQREPGHRLYVSSSISSTLKTTISQWFSSAIPVLVPGRCCTFLHGC